MAGCNCKGTTINGETNNDIPISFFQNIIKYGLKTIMFSIFLLMLPLIIIYVIYLAFNIIVLNENVNMKPLLLAIGNKFREKDDVDNFIDEEELKNLTEEDVILLDADDITDKQFLN